VAPAQYGAIARGTPSFQKIVYPRARAGLAWLWLAPGVAGAHAPAAPNQPPTLATAFSIEPFALPILLLAGALYLLGLRALWRHGPGHGVSLAQAASFGAGSCVVVLAMIWPLDAYGGWLLSAHMAQHMLLLAAAPPLLVAGLPGPVWLAALRPGWARGLMRPFRSPRSRSGWRVLARPGPAMLLQAAVMWGWHLPVAMELALRNEPVHYLMHASFLVAGLLFWTALLRSLREPTHGAGAGVVAIVGTMIHMGLLSALLTFATTPLYPYYLDRAPALGLTALEDQQLAGLIMWVPSALPYLVGGLVLAAVWLRRAERASLAERAGP
jgi:putative membrane protein